VEQDEYDVILLDCPPSLGILFMNALYCADSIVIPIQAEYLALEGLSVIVSVIEQVRNAGNPGLSIEGIVLTMYDVRTNLAQQVAAAGHGFGDLVVELLGLAAPQGASAAGPVRAFHHGHLQAACHQVVGGGLAGGAGADDHNVVVLLGHGFLRRIGFDFNLPVNGHCPFAYH